MVVVAVAVLVSTGGGVPPVGTMAAGPFGVTVIVKLARAPGASVPMLAVTLPVANVGFAAAVEVAELNVTFGSSASTTDTLLAILGPLLVTVTT